MHFKSPPPTETNTLHPSFGCKYKEKGCYAQVFAWLQKSYTFSALIWIFFVRQAFFMSDGSINTQKNQYFNLSHAMSTSRPIWKFTTSVKNFNQPPFTIAGFFTCVCKFGKFRNRFRRFQTVHNFFGLGTNLAEKDHIFDLKAWKLQVIQSSLYLFSKQNISNSKKTPWPSLAWLDCMITYHHISQICALTRIQNMYDSIFWTIECMKTGYTFIHCNPKSESHPALATIMDLNCIWNLLNCII